jgi:hypothetical protein
VEDEEAVMEADLLDSSSEAVANNPEEDAIELLCAASAPGSTSPASAKAEAEGNDELTALVTDEIELLADAPKATCPVG